MGILPPEPAALEALSGAIAGEAATLVSPEAAAFDGGALDPAPGYQHAPSYQHAGAGGAGLAEELARLHTQAYLDAEIARYFRLQDLDDEEAMVTIFAATLH